MYGKTLLTITRDGEEAVTLTFWGNGRFTISDDEDEGLTASTALKIANRIKSFLADPEKVKQEQKRLRRLERKMDEKIAKGVAESRTNTE